MAAPAFCDVEFPPAALEPLDCAAAFGPAAQAIVLRHFRELLEQREHVWDNAEVEAVHRIRVAARRTRTALQTFAALWPAGESRPYLDELADFADRFNAARDLDVMIIYLREQLRDAETGRRAALEWLLERNIELRRKEQPKLERALLRFERRKQPQRFVDYFARKPLDLWPKAGRSAGPTGSGGVPPPGSTALRGGELTGRESGPTDDGMAGTGAGPTDEAATEGRPTNTDEGVDGPG